MSAAPAGESILLRDSTLREGLDTPGVAFSLEERLEIARALAAAGVAEAEIVAPSRVAEGLVFARALADASDPAFALRRSGLVYASGDDPVAQVAAAAGALDHVDLLMPLSARREPHEPAAKVATLVRHLAAARGVHADVGAGFPHATQAEPGFVEEIAGRAAAAGATRITLYDTNGSSDPERTHALVTAIAAIGVPVFFHAHDDLGLATANARSAVRAGARGLDVTVNGLGDRAGNASLEQLVVLLAIEGHATGVDARRLGALSALVERLSGVPVSGLAPVVGRFVFHHRSPAHLPAPGEFEAYDPALVGSTRRIDRTGQTVDRDLVAKGARS